LLSVSVIVPPQLLVVSSSCRHSSAIAPLGVRRYGTGITAWRLLAALVLLVSGLAWAEGITVPAGFRIEVFAAGLGGARALAVDPAGVLLVSVPARGQVVALPDRKAPGRARTAVTVLDDLDLPDGLAFRRGHLYVAQTDRIVRYRYDARTLAAVEPSVVVRGLPDRTHHWTRSIAFGPDGKLYVAIGSSCNACQERDPRRAAILRYDADGRGEQRYATGLRNPVGLVFHPSTGALWTTVNERDWAGGGAPPDYVTDVRPGAVYGWPRCYAQGRVFFPDPSFAESSRCEALTLPAVELPAHAAPLGLAFYTGTQFPPEYAGDLFVALHGSRAGLTPAGYAIARIRFRGGRAIGVEPFSTGWRGRDLVLGRPVDLVVGRDGSLFVSDDHGDRVHRVSYTPP
jgi:glucose/arabinose dehydrogenase